MKKLLILVLIVSANSISYSQEAIFGKENISFNLGVSILGNQIGPVAALGYCSKDSPLYGEIYFNYFVSVLKQNSNLWNDAKAGVGALGLNFSPNYLSANRLKFLMGFGACTINEQTGANYLEKYSGSVSYMVVYGGLRYFFAEILAAQGMLGYAFVSNDSDGILKKRPGLFGVQDYENGITFQLSLGFYL
jgi:hypothetical protein